MLSWRMARRMSGSTVAAAVTLALLVPVPAHADGTVVSGGAPGTVTAPPKPVQVKTTTVPSVASGQTPVPNETTAPDKKPSRVVAELDQTSTAPFGMIGVTWAADSTATGMTVEVRTRTSGSWSEWTDLEVDSDESGGTPGTEPLWVGSADGVAARVTSTAGVPEDVRITTIDAGAEGEDANAETASYTESLDTVDGVADAEPIATTDGSPKFTPKPTIITRSSWGAAGGTKCDTPLTGDRTRGVVVHHTAGSNSYSASESKAIVRSTQAYHMKARSWCDIGYNFLVDKYGQIFEGRAGGVDRAVRAAHSGNLAVNTYTMGVSMMGDYDKAQPSAALKTAMVKLVGWRLGTNYLPAKGTYSLGGKTLNMIAGHRNVISTACPGKYGYAWLSAKGGLRDRVEDYIAKYNTPIKTLWKSLGSAKVGAIYIGESSSSAGGRLWGKSMELLNAGSGPAYAVSGAMLTEYNRAGSRSGTLGYPVTGVTALTGSTRQGFQKGRIYLPTGKSKAYNLTGGILSLYVALGESKSALGAPTSSMTVSGGVSKATFSKGYITLSGSRATAYNSSGKVISTGTTPTPPSAPAKVSGVTVKAGNHSARLAWSPVSGATSYTVCLLTGSVTTPCSKVFAGLTSPAAHATSLTPRAGTDYTFVVRAFKGSVAGPWSDRKAFNLTAPEPPAPSAPAKVSGVTVKAGNHSARLAWSPVSGATSYTVCLLTGSVTTPCSKVFAGLTSPAAHATSLTPRAGTDYTFVVRAFKGSVAGPWSDRKAFNLTAAAAASESKTVPSSGTFTVKGRGFGHGIGMSQYGAQGAATKGVKYDKILSTYYPGTKLATKSGSIRVLISQDTTDAVEVARAGGLYFRNVRSGSKIALPTSVDGASVTRWRIIQRSTNKSQSTLQYRTSVWRDYKEVRWTGDGQFEGPTTIGLILPNGTTVRYRGAIRSAVPSSGSTARDTVNVLTLEEYLRGVVGAEMPASWKPEALKAQAVAARTYGVRALAPSRHYDICDTTACQVYGGLARESASVTAAISATSGKILTYGGTPALAQFSSSSGGYTAVGSQPYLKAVTDPYDDWSGNPNRSWTATVRASTVQKTYPSIGTLKQVKITKRTGGGTYGGRIATVSLVGSKKSVTITGTDARWAFGLKSNWFAF